MTVLSKEKMILATEVGRGIDNHTGNTYTLLMRVGAPGIPGSMLIRSEKSGRTFCFGWEDAIRMAQEQGVDNANAAG